jgi:hypothetical protein
MKLTTALALAATTSYASCQEVACSQSLSYSIYIGGGIPLREITDTYTFTECSTATPTTTAASCSESLSYSIYIGGGIPLREITETYTILECPTNGANRVAPTTNPIALTESDGRILDATFASNSTSAISTSAASANSSANATVTVASISTQSTSGGAKLAVALSVVMSLAGLAFLA